MSALHWAAAKSSAEVAKLLVDANAKLDLEDKVGASGVTAEEIYSAGVGVFAREASNLFPYEEVTRKLES